MLVKSEQVRSEEVKSIEYTRINNKINPENAFRITKRVSIPRLVGTKGEKKAQKIILEEFQKVGYKSVHRDEFKTSFYNLNFIRRIYIITGLLLLFISLTAFINSWLSLIFIMFLIVLARYSMSLASNLDINLMRDDSKNIVTENISAELHSPTPKKRTIIFMAHYDSKGQTFSASSRQKIMQISTIGSMFLLLSFLILNCIQLIFSSHFIFISSILLWFTILIMAFGIMNYFIKTDNRSVGSSDNAAAVGLVLELARYYQVNPLEDMRFIFLTTGSEELNLGGVKEFIKKNGNRLDKESTYFINFDPIGVGTLRLITQFGKHKSSDYLNDIFQESAKTLDIDLIEMKMAPGVWSDSIPIVRQGFESAWLSTIPVLKYVHTVDDNMDLITTDCFNAVLLLCIDIVNKISRG